MATEQDYAYHGMINLRRLRCDERADFLARPASQWTRLAPEVMIPTKLYAPLPPWEKLRLRTAAMGLSAYRAVVVGRSAARILGLPLLEIEHDVELATGKRPGRQLRGVRYRCWRLREEEVTSWHGVRVTSLARTLFDLARTMELPGQLAALDHALRHWHVNERVLADAFDGFGALPGTKKARKALRLSDADAESPLESWVRGLIIDAGLGTPKLQVPVRTASGFYRVDMMLDGGTVIEVDGEVKYANDALATAEIRLERTREKALVNHGLRVVRATKATVADGSFISELRRSLRDDRAA